jgi:uncharacterized RDD family membrane protein YckC
VSEQNTYDANPFAPPLADVHDTPAAAGEQVLATRGARFLAVLIDSAPFFVIGLIAAIAIPATVRGRDAFTYFGVFGLVMALASVVWLVIMITLSYRYGQTIGKRAMGLRVVRLDGSRIAFSRIFFMRNLVPALVGLIPIVGNFFGLIDPLWIFGGEKRCLHDLIADSRVVTAESSPDATLDGWRRTHRR